MNKSIDQIKITNKFAKHKKRLRDAGIAALFLFGSRSLGIAGPLSDTDIAILLKKSVPEDKTLKATVKLENFLLDIDPDIKDIQVTILNNAPISLQNNVLREGKMLVGLEPEILANFKEKTMMKAGDLLPFLGAYMKEHLDYIYGNRHQSRNN